MKTKQILFILTILFLSVIISCKKPPYEKLKINDQDIFGLASPIKLNFDTTVVYLSDYFNDCSKTTEIIPPHGLKIISNFANDTLVFLSDESLLPVTLLDIKTENNNYSIPILKSRKLKHIFTVDDLDNKYSSVAIAGDMNAWNPVNNNFTYSDGKWTTNLYLEPDKYAYRLFFDGNEILDPNNSDSISNGMGGWNSVLNIRSSNSGLIPELNTDKTKDNFVTLSLSDVDSKVICLFQNYKINSIQNKNKITIKIPDEAKSVKRTYIRAWAYNNAYYSSEVIIPLDFGKVITESSQLTRQDKETNIMYFMMVDRFYNAKKTNDRPLNDREVIRKADFHGGDIAGITEKIDKGYFNDLGVNCLWLSPIVKNPEGKYGLFNKGGYKTKFSSYHGYWPVSFTEIDDRFGTSADLKTLVEAAHKNNNNVVLDIVAHHVHEKSPFYINNKDKKWTTDLYLPDGTLNTEKWDEHRLTTWFDVFLPTLNLAIPEVADIVADSTVYWLTQKT